MWVSTFHSLCARLLRREAPAIGLSRDFVIYDSSDQLTVVKQALKELQIDDSFVQPRAALSRISHAKNRMEGPEPMAAPPAGTAATSRSRRSTRYYLNALKESNALDFDDLLLEDRRARSRQSERVATKYAQQFRFVMVDEYQDTNRPQYLLIRRLAEHPSQPVRRRRSGSVDLQVARRRPAQHPRLRAGLSRSRRSSSSNATTARRRSSSTRRRRSSARTATARTSSSGPTARAARGSSTSAAATSSRRPTSSPAPHGRALADDVEATVAVLYRTNAQSRTIEDALMREGIAYKVVGGVRFYERKEIKDALAYMRLVINPHDDVSLRRVINVPARGIGKGVMDAIEKIVPPRRRRRRCRCWRPGSQPAHLGQLAVGAPRARPRRAAVHRPRGGVAGGVSRSDRRR